ncbi:P63C domain-containing protein [Eleftheria terrae]|uniref:P63C domain-containing protein n=1 Tax=Eleftheria terrae TaxID=1597781 RepID=UPI00263B8119|nr:P63C domain-containing protein [Eleftheria terrae]WKB56066.1 P63C domain-containing protein [Eleftheria terrae]
MNSSVVAASHYGVVRFGDLECEAVVLNSGERGYARRQLAKLLGFHETHKGGRFARFSADFPPKSLPCLEKSPWPILLPTGQQAQFFPAGIIADAAAAVVNAALGGTLHKSRRAVLPNCMTISQALATTGEVALINEATGFQYRRGPDALQQLIARLLRQSCASWERRFHPEYYRAIYRLFGWRRPMLDFNGPGIAPQCVACDVASGAWKFSSLNTSSYSLPLPQTKKMQSRAVARRKAPRTFSRSLFLPATSTTCTVLDD